MSQAVIWPDPRICLDKSPDRVSWPSRNGVACATLRVVKRFLGGTVAGIALAALVAVALLLLTGLRVTDQSVKEEIAHSLLGAQAVVRCCGRPPSVSVPNLIGMSTSAARSVLNNDELKTRLVTPRRGSASGGPNLVVQAQNPSAGTLASPGRTVTLYALRE